MALPRRQRVAAYAVIVRQAPDGQPEILLCRLAARISRTELWTLPGGGLDHGEDPRDALLREITEETGLHAVVGETAHVYSAHLPRASRDGVLTDLHALRIVYDAWVPADAPEPRVVEVDGSTAEARWQPLSAVMSGEVPVVATVAEALADREPHRLQRVAAYALVTRGRQVLLTRLSARAAHPGFWTLPGGGVHHGEPPLSALAREVKEECGAEVSVGELLGVHDTHFSGTAPSGRLEDYRGIHLIYAATVPDDVAPEVVEEDGTTAESAWIDVEAIEDGSAPVLDVVTYALSLAADRRP